MADIHIGKIAQSETGKGKAQLIYHIPIDTPKAGIVPTSESSIASRLEQSELDALAAGELVELSKDIAIQNSDTQSTVVVAIKKNWQSEKTQYNEQYNFEHKFYGVTLSAST